MVSMIPPTISINNPVSEKDVFNALKLTGGARDWIAIHSLKQARSIKNLSAETDFVVLVPGQGIVLIEAKGATAVKIEGNKWTMEGVPPEARHKDPLGQLDGSIANIRRYLKKQKLIDYSMPITRLVWFTSLAEGSIDDKKKDQGMELYPWELAWLEDLDDPRAIIERNLRSYVREHQSLDDKDFEPAKLTPELARQIATALRVDIEVSSDKASQALARDIRVNQATKEQVAILNMVATNPNLYFEGGAGSGKTQLVVESALNFAEQGKQVLLTAWTKMMAERLEKRFNGVPNVHVSDVGAILAEIANQQKPDDMSRDDWFDRRLAEIALDEIGKHPEHAAYDAICIDEFQDIATKPEVCRAVFALLRNEKEGSIVLAGDDEQQIMATSTKVNAFEVAQSLKPNFSKVSLNSNCRQAPELSIAIHDFLDMDASKLNHLVPFGGEHTFEVIETTEASQLKDLARLVNRLTERFDEKDIRILSPFGKVRSSLAVLFNTPMEQVYSKEVRKMMPLLKHDSSPEGKITWRSISSFKGLEQDVIVIVDVNQDAKNWLESEGKNLREQLYVGMTRARFHLFVLVSDGLYAANSSIDGTPV